MPQKWLHVRVCVETHFIINSRDIQWLQYGLWSLPGAVICNNKPRKPSFTSCVMVRDLLLIKEKATESIKFPTMVMRRCLNLRSLTLQIHTLGKVASVLNSNLNIRFFWKFISYRWCIRYFLSKVELNAFCVTQNHWRWNSNNIIHLYSLLNNEPLPNNQTIDVTTS